MGLQRVGHDWATNTHTDVAWLPGPRGGGVGSWGLTGTEFQFGKMKRVLEMDGGDGCPAMWMDLMPLNQTLRKGTFYIIIFCHNKAKLNLHIHSTRTYWMAMQVKFYARSWEIEGWIGYSAYLRKGHKHFYEDIIILINHFFVFFIMSFLDIQFFFVCLRNSLTL